jgi:transcriptional regulator of acetoin/glycerol metabolism
MTSKKSGKVPLEASVSAALVTRRDDILMVVIQHLRLLMRTHAGLDLTDAQAQLVEASVRANLGGLRVCIPKRKKHPTAEQRKAILHDVLDLSVSDEEIIRRHGISRSTMYRLLKKL